MQILGLGYSLKLVHFLQCFAIAAEQFCCDLKFWFASHKQGFTVRQRQEPKKVRI